jgi:cation:H+ antiporter
MASLLIPSILFIIGLVLLVWSSDIFIDGASSVAKHMSISPLIIGVVVLGFGTSSPEILVSIHASLDNSPALAIGNVIGSNIANIALVLGVTAMVSPIIVKSSLLKQEFPIVIAVSFLGIILMLDGDLDETDGIILLITLIITMIWMIKANKQTNINDKSLDPDPLKTEIIQELNQLKKISLSKSITMLISGIIVLIISANLMVTGAIDIAKYFNIPDLIIGLTIIAIGTSLPELAAAIAAAKKSEKELMIGNILGSNLFNILAVLAMPALISPSTVDKTALLIDYPIMLMLTVVMMVIALPKNGKSVIRRWVGFLLTLSFVAYLVLIYFRTVAN